MSDTTIVETYFNAWDDHDPAAVIACFNEEGSYCDPVAGKPLQGDAIGQHAQSLFDAFPDLKLELICNTQASNGMIAAPWLLFGTHDGPLAEHQATGKPVVLHGCDFITVSNGKIDAVQGFFDPNDIFRQLGLA